MAIVGGTAVHQVKIAEGFLSLLEGCRITITVRGPKTDT